jgi:hypothetical protein
METVAAPCGRPTRLEGEEYVGTIAFHGEEGFTDAEATRAPLRLEPIFDLVCGGASVGPTAVGGRLPGAQLKISRDGGPSPGASAATPSATNPPSKRGVSRPALRSPAKRPTRARARPRGAPRPGHLARRSQGQFPRPRRRPPRRPRLLRVDSPRTTHRKAPRTAIGGGENGGRGGLVGL